MRCVSTASALVASLLAKDVLAVALHRLHHDHDRVNMRALKTVYEDTVETIYTTVYVTLDGPPESTPPVYKGVPAVISTSASHSSTSTPTTDESTPQPPPPAAAPTTSSISTSTTPPPPPPPRATPTTFSTASKPSSVAEQPAVSPADLVQVSKPSATTSYAPPPTTTPVTSSTKKRGLAYNDASLCKDFLGSDSLVSWGYNWGSSSSGLDSSFDYCPMLWGLGSQFTSSWQKNAEAAIASGSTHLLYLNEADLSSQSGVDCNTAAANYLTYMQPYAGRVKLGSVSVTNGPSPMGLAYLQNFLQACSKCTIDFVNVHWYDSATNYAYFKKHVQDAYNAGGGRPVWITEFGASGSLDEQNTFLKTVLPWLDAQPYVERYAYFMVKDGILISGSGLSELGQTYKTYTSNTISPLIA